MNLTSDGKRMLDWAKNNYSLDECEEVFTLIDKSVSSYYEKREESDSLVYEYDFNDFPQIKAYLDELWQGEPVMKEMVLISSVSVMKNKPVEEKQESGLESIGSKMSDGEVEIPEYVYIF